jgi:orotate phosphoribosyltransferase
MMRNISVMTSNQENFKNEFITFALDAQVLAFGEFKTKAGRLSPYFFNAGGFNDGALLKALGEFYAKALINSGLEFDMLFGPAYKGITLAATTAVALASMGKAVPFCFNRKEAKDHGEGGSLVGAPLKGRVVIIDDVISAGTSVRESVEIIRQAGATPSAVLIALDRMERSGNATEVGDSSAVQNVEKEFGVPVVSIANLASLMSFLESSQSADLQKHLPKVQAYRDQYGI